MKISRENAINLFTALGIATASKWTDKRLADKINRVDKLVDEDTQIDDESLDNLLSEVLDSIEDGQEIALGKPSKKPAQPVEDDKSKEAENDTITDSDDDMSSDDGMDSTSDAPPTEKAPKPKPEPVEKEKKPKPSRVRYAKTRSYCAGLIVARNGMKQGITQEMIDELDDIYGRPNPHESECRLKYAWHALRGFVDFRKSQKKTKKK